MMKTLNLLQVTSLLPVHESLTCTTCCVGPKNLPCAKIAPLKILAKLVGNGNRAENREQEWILFLVMAIGIAKHGQHRSQLLLCG
jgi:hypothetical protein